MGLLSESLVLVVVKSLAEFVGVALVEQDLQVLHGLPESGLHTVLLPLQDGYLLAQVQTDLLVDGDPLLPVGDFPAEGGELVFCVGAVGEGDLCEGEVELGEGVGVQHIQIIIVSCQKWEQSTITIMQTDRFSQPNDMGLFNPYKLDDLLNLQSDGWTSTPPLRLAYHLNHALHLEEAPITLFERYAKHEVVFCAIMGSPRSGKSLLLDRVAQLCEL